MISVSFEAMCSFLGCCIEHLLQSVDWSVGGVCKWAESVAKQQNTLGGASVHPDDIRAGIDSMFVCIHVHTCQN